MATIEMKLKPWAIPNGAMVDMPPRGKQDGFVVLPAFDLKELPVAALDEQVREWLNAVYKVAGHDCPWFIRVRG